MLPPQSTASVSDPNSLGGYKRPLLQEVCQSNLTMVFLTHAETQVLQTLAAYNCRISEKNGRTGVRARGYSVDSIFLLDRLESLDSISVSYTSVHRLALEKRILLPPQLLAAIAEQSAARINDIYCSSESASSRIGSFSCASVSYALW